MKEVASKVTCRIEHSQSHPLARGPTSAMGAVSVPAFIAWKVHATIADAVGNVQRTGIDAFVCFKTHTPYADDSKKTESTMLHAVLKQRPRYPGACSKAQPVPTHSSYGAVVGRPLPRSASVGEHLQGRLPPRYPTAPVRSSRRRRGCTKSLLRPPPVVGRIRSPIWRVGVCDACSARNSPAHETGATYPPRNGEQRASTSAAPASARFGA